MKRHAYKPSGLKCPSGIDGSCRKTGGGKVASIDWSFTKPIFPKAVAKIIVRVTANRATLFGRDIFTKPTKHLGLKPTMTISNN